MMIDPEFANGWECAIMRHFDPINYSMIVFRRRNDSIIDYMDFTTGRVIRSETDTHPGAMVDPPPEVLLKCSETGVMAAMARAFAGATPENLMAELKRQQSRNEGIIDRLVDKALDDVTG